MNRKLRSESDARPARWYRGADVLMRVIRRFACQVGQRFQPDRIILFGSYAYGTPNADSDVDILVIMLARNELDQAFKIRCAVPRPFPMDLLVLDPRNVEWRLAERQSFLVEIMTKGKVLYEKDYPRVGFPLPKRGEGRGYDHPSLVRPPGFEDHRWSPGFRKT